MVAGPMPGLEPEDISVAITDPRVTIRGMERGPGQHEHDLLLAEWTIGPYYREVFLPQPVDVPLANVTYGTGCSSLRCPSWSPDSQTPKQSSGFMPSGRRYTASVWGIAAVLSLRPRARSISRSLKPKPAVSEKDRFAPT
jgi:hypothetical protein